MENSELEELLESLPKETNLIAGWTLYNYKGFWLTTFLLKNLFSIHKHFVALDGDLLLASSPKSGTTWLKAISYSIVNRSRFSLHDTPLLTANPHALVLNLEFDVYDKPESRACLDAMPNPRLLCTHLPYSLLPVSIRNSDCKIVYICRNTMDQFVSYWHFYTNYLEGGKPESITEESFDQFCRGVQALGPFWDHVSEFWKASQARPRKILLMRYEDLKKDGVSQVKRLAEFLGFPFSEEEEKQGLAEAIIKFCSIGNMKTLEGNINGQRPSGTLNSTYFRKGEIGDWMNHLTPAMAERLKKLVEEKSESSSLPIMF